MLYLVISHLSQAWHLLVRLIFLFSSFQQMLAKSINYADPLWGILFILLLLPASNITVFS
jgi:hypothetical protein